jgi:hypothetical protein
MFYKPKVVTITPTNNLRVETRYIIEGWWLQDAVFAPQYFCLFLSVNIFFLPIFIV